jgi:hypothetical protein
MHQNSVLVDEVSLAARAPFEGTLPIIIDNISCTISAATSEVVSAANPRDQYSTQQTKSGHVLTVGVICQRDVRSAASTAPKTYLHAGATSTTSAPLHGEEMCQHPS